MPIPLKILLRGGAALSALWLLAACSEPGQAVGEGGGQAQDAVLPFDAGGKADAGGVDGGKPDTQAGGDVAHPLDALLTDGGTSLDAGAGDVVEISDGGDNDAGSDDGGGIDSAIADTAGADGGSADVPQPDAGGKPALKCGEHEFSYAAPAGTFEVLVAGSFNGWAPKAPQAWAMDDSDGDGVWTVVKKIQPGQWEYRFIVDGKWIEDPTNPNKKKNEFNEYNSVLDMPECPEGLQLISHKTEEATGGFTAELSWLAGGIKGADVVVTVDLGAAPAGAATVAADGKTISVKLSGLKKGIHDVRVKVGEETALLKVYVGVSTDWRDATLYFVMTDRFVNGDTKNDFPVKDVDARTNYQGGDFAGVKKKIESGYFDDLGVGAIWLSWPVDNPDGYEDGSFPDQEGCGLGPKNTKYSPMRYTGNHGYWPKDLYKTDEHFGTMAELQALVGAAHARGIRILLDFTANHVHTSSPFYDQHKDDNFFHFPKEICQDVGWDNKPVTCWFTSYLADMNYGNPAAIEAMLDYALFWAKETGSDGFRLDAVKHVEMAFVKALRARTKKEMERTGVPFYIVGETFTGDAGTIAAFLGGDKIHGQFDFPANMAILKGLAKKEMGLDAMDKSVRAAKGVYGGDALMSNFIGNHDIARFISMASGSVPCGIWDVVSNQAAGWKKPPQPPTDKSAYDRLQLAFAYIMTVPGVPLIYYGDEFGLPGAGDPDNRRMMRFDTDLNDNEKATLAWMQKLGKARQAHVALRQGEWGQPLASEADLLAWSRTTASEKAVVVLNRGDAEKSGDLQVGGIGVLDGAKMVEALGGGTATVSGGKLSYKLAPRSAAIWVTQ